MTRQEFNRLKPGDRVQAHLSKTIGSVTDRPFSGKILVRWDDNVGHEQEIVQGFAPLLDLAPTPAGPCAVGKDQLPEDPDGGKA
jgi:hypothetical protein